MRICTAPVNEYRYCVGEKIAWVEKHLGADWAKRVILTKDKTLVRGDILIDDKSHITGSLKPMWTHRIYDAPHNRHINAPQRIVWAQAETGQICCLHFDSSKAAWQRTAIAQSLDNTPALRVSSIA